MRLRKDCCVNVVTGDYIPLCIDTITETVSLVGLRIPCLFLRIFGNACKKTLIVHCYTIFTERKKK